MYLNFQECHMIIIGKKIKIRSKGDAVIIKNPAVVQWLHTIN